MKILLSQYAAKNYAPGSEPSSETLRRRAENQDYEFIAVKEGGRWYLDLDRPNVSDDLARRLIA